MKEYGLQLHLVMKFWENSDKIFHLEHHFHLLNACKKYAVRPTVLKINQTRNTCPALHSFINERKGFIKDTAKWLVLKKNQKNLISKLNCLDINITNLLLGKVLNSSGKRIWTKWKELEEKSFNCRITYQNIRRSYSQGKKQKQK